MSIDAFDPCPGGLGKKVKFCCPDLVGDLAKIDRMREGNQTTACLAWIERLEARHPGRACLLAIKADLLRGMGRVEEAGAAIEGLMEKSGAANPVALSESALIAVQSGETLEAVELFQKALSAVPQGQAWPDAMFETLPTIAVALVNEGYLLAARSHLSLLRAIQPEDQGVMDALISISSSPNISLLFKQRLELEYAPENVAWQAEFNQIVDLARTARWLEAAEKFEALVRAGNQAPELYRNLAILRLRLGDDHAASEAYHDLADCDLPLDDAVEAKAMAQLLDPLPDEFDMQRIVYPVTDLDRFHEVLLSDTRCVSLPMPPTTRSGEPPAKAAFSLLDRHTVATHVDLTLDSLPRLLGTVTLYGKQTDRDARLELSCWRPDRTTAAQSLLAELGFGMLGAPGAAELLDSVPVDEALLELSYYFPRDTPADKRDELARQHQQRAIEKEWAQIPRHSLNEKSPAQAAADPAFRIPLLAALLRLELHCESVFIEFDFDQLRAALGLPLPDPIVPGEAGIETILATRFCRVAMSQLNEEQLIMLMQLSGAQRATTAMRRACREQLSRLGETKPRLRAQLLADLITTTNDSREQLRLIEQARQVAVAAGDKSGTWDLLELRTRMGRGEGEQARPLLEHLVAEHMHEPDVREAVTQLLMQLGLIRPDGTPARRMPSADAMAPEPAQAAGKLWTPDSATGGEKKSLWVPD